MSKHKKRLFATLIVVIGFMLIVILINVFKVNQLPEVGTVNEIVYIDHPILTIQDGITYAKQIVFQWGKQVALRTISVVFDGQEAIKNRKGNITYYFSVIKSKENRLPADAFVTLDMNNNAITGFTVDYDSRIKNAKFSKADLEAMSSNMHDMETDKWSIDIDKAFDIAKDKIGEDRILQCENPKIVLRCTENEWEFAIYSSIESQYADTCIVINPNSGEVLRIEK